MSEESLPTLFVSHGAPTLPMENVPAREFLKELGSRFREEKSILCISAHWATTRPAVNAGEEPQTIHDFSGFPEELYRIEYPSHGSPDLARRVAGLIEDVGMACDIDGRRGLDHGAWVPMLLMHPEADVSVVQLSIQENLDPAQHFALGRAIAVLRREGVLVIGSGGAVHPLGYVPLGPGMATHSWAIEFNDWLTKAVEGGDAESLIDYRKSAPHAETAHHYPDHYMPLLAALGAAGPGARGKVIHHSWYWGDLGMDAFEFDTGE
jgi:4,5-DOPA dioxygenase extradiol